MTKEEFKKAESIIIRLSDINKRLELLEYDQKVILEKGNGDCTIMTTEGTFIHIDSDYLKGIIKNNMLELESEIKEIESKFSKL